MHSDDEGPWIQIDLVDSTVVTGVITQGHWYWDAYVKEYKVSFKKLPSSPFEHVTDGSGNPKASSHNFVDVD